MQWQSRVRKRPEEADKEEDEVEVGWEWRSTVVINKGK